jgi:hypothetical protein
VRKPGGQASSPSNPSLLGIAQSSAPRSSFPRSVLVPETPAELFGDAVIDDAFGRAAREIDELQGVTSSVATPAASFT